MAILDASNHVARIRGRSVPGSDLAAEFSPNPKEFFALDAAASFVVDERSRGTGGRRCNQRNRSCPVSSSGHFLRSPSGHGHHLFIDVPVTERFTPLYLPAFCDPMPVIGTGLC